MQITIDHTQVAGSAGLTNFPVLISALSTDLMGTGTGGSVGRIDGLDILFTASDGTTKLDHEIESYSPSAGQVIAWVRVPFLSSNADTVLFMYYGNASASDQSNRGGVWDAGYGAVYHMSDDGSGASVSDSTTLNAAGLASGSTSSISTLGKIGNGFAFNGTNSIATSIQASGGTYTISFWANRNNDGYVFQNNDWGTSHLTVDFGSYCQVNSFCFASADDVWHNVGTSPAIMSNLWFYATLVLNSSTSTAIGYVNGAQLGTAPYSEVGSINDSLNIGQASFSGALDEFRLSTTIRSADWIATEFANQNAPVLFYSIAATENNPALLPTTTVTTNPVGLSITVDGNTYTAPQTFQWLPGSSHLLSAGSPQGAGTGTQSVWNTWSDQGTATHSITAAPLNTTYTANFTTQSYLATTANPVGSGTITPASGWFNVGATLSVSASPTSGYELSAFSGALTGSSTPQPLTISGPTAVTASFLASTGPPKILVSGPPVLTHGSIFQFQADRAVTWACPGCAGSIDSLTGLYKAPGTVKSKSAFAGCQMLPNDHVFNTRIESLPVNPNNASWMTPVNLSLGPLYENSAAPNYVDPSTPAEPEIFLYTPGNNGNFLIPQLPYATIEGGWYVNPFGGVDRHLNAVNRATCDVQEMYDYYPAGANVDCATCTSQSGVKYSGTSYALPTGATDAAGMFTQALMLRVDEIELAAANGGEIQHALRTTMPNAWINQSHIWPATTHASVGAGPVPYGARMRLKSIYDVADFCTTETWCIKAKILLTQLAHYGLIIADGTAPGLAWELNYVGQPDPDLRAAFAQISAVTVNAANFEFIDESGIEYDGDSDGGTTVGVERVTATSSANGSVATMRVILQGVTVGIDPEILYIQAGSSKQFSAWVNGAPHGNRVEWSISPASGAGTVSASGLYIAPENVDTVTTATITAISRADPTVFVKVAVTIYPSGPLRFASAATPGLPYVDSTPDHYTWQPMPTTVGHSYNNGGSYPGASDPNLYQTIWYDSGDMVWDLTVPAGNYAVALHEAEGENNAPNVNVMKLESQGTIYDPSFDTWALAGGQFKPHDVTLPAVVGSDGRLYIALRAFHDPQDHTHVSSFLIAPDSGVPRLTISPSSTSIYTGQVLQFTTIGWYMSNSVVWSMSPQVGSIDANGVYHAPQTPIGRDVNVTITATSTTNPGQTATATIKVFGATIPDIRINCGGGSLIDAEGNVWATDYDYTLPSNSYGESVPIAKTTPDLQPLYQSYRYAYVGDPPFTYTIPVANATYSVTLKFAEFHYAAEHNPPVDPVMDVLINQAKVLSNFDLVGTCGRQAACDRTFSVPVTDNSLDITFVPLSSASYVGAAINGIHIACTSGCGDKP